MRITNLDNLSDKGKSLIDKVKSYEKSLENERQTLQTMVPRVEPLGPNNAFNKVQVAWDDVHLGINSVQPRTLGKTGKFLGIQLFIMMQNAESFASLKKLGNQIK